MRYGYRCTQEFYPGFYRAQLRGYEAVVASYCGPNTGLVTLASGGSPTTSVRPANTVYQTSIRCVKSPPGVEPGAMSLEGSSLQFRQQGR